MGARHQPQVAGNPTQGHVHHHRTSRARARDRASRGPGRDPSRAARCLLCHAWDDRETAAKELHDLLESYGVDVWFSEKDVALGTTLMRSIDKGLKVSRIGVVLVTPAMLRSLANEGVADKELAVLLATERVIPVVHETTFGALLDESPMLASRAV